MDRPGGTHTYRWRRFAVDILTGAAALSVAMPVWAAADVLDALLLAIALVGTALLIEPSARSVDTPVATSGGRLDRPRRLHLSRSPQ